MLRIALISFFILFSFKTYAVDKYGDIPKHCVRLGRRGANALVDILSKVKPVIDEIDSGSDYDDEDDWYQVSLEIYSLHFFRECYTKNFHTVLYY